MELLLKRRYHSGGTNGTLWLADTLICHTIELPWRNNERRVSCILEGRYAVRERFSPRFQLHLILKDVPGRSLILVHPANDARKELLGCIAPVTRLTGPGKGTGSRKAMQLVLRQVVKALQDKELLFLTIQKDDTV